MAIQPDGKIVVAGSATIAGNQNIVLVRYDTTGHLDPTFGFGGGVTRMTQEFFGDMLVAQYTSDGAPDATFGRAGLAVTDFDERVDAGRADVAFAVAIQPDDKILAAGVADFNETSSFAIARYQVATRCGPGIEC